MSRPFDVFEAGAWSDLSQFCFQPKPDFKIEGKLFVGERLGMTGAEVSLNRVPAGWGMPFYHRHTRNEELFLFVGGEGEMVIGEERVPVREGTLVRVAPSADRIFRNTSDRDLYYVCVQYPVSAERVREGADGVISERPLPW
jgi:mannose-6-phosphate isomerase-like protein (cupin superfamily)